MVQVDLTRQNLIARIGNTPLLDLSSYSPAPGRVKIFAKAEWCNPGGSVKDRAAWNIVQQALKNGELAGDRRLLDASSGNTGLAYAMLGAALKFGVTLAVPENVGELQKRILAALGAEVTYTPASESSDGAIRHARDLAQAHPPLFFYADQYSNTANWRAHYETTAVEIWRQTEQQVTHFIAGLGTTGTFMGTSRRLRDYNPSIRCLTLEPDSAFHGIEGLKQMESAIVPAIYRPDQADGHRYISTESAQEYVLTLARHEGLLVGISSGAALSGAIELAREIDNGLIVTIFPDSAYRYLEERFWDEASDG